MHGAVVLNKLNMANLGAIFVRKLQLGYKILRKSTTCANKTHAFLRYIFDLHIADTVMGSLPGQRSLCLPFYLNIARKNVVLEVDCNIMVHPVIKTS